MRTQITDAQIQVAIEKTVQKLDYRLVQKGYGTFASRHEILGSLTEEYYELVEAVHAKNFEWMNEELLDLAVGAIFAVACLDQGTIDR